MSPLRRHTSARGDHRRRNEILSAAVCSLWGPHRPCDRSKSATTAIRNDKGWPSTNTCVWSNPLQTRLVHVWLEIHQARRHSLTRVGVMSLDSNGPGVVSHDCFGVPLFICQETAPRHPSVTSTHTSCTPVGRLCSYRLRQ